MDDLEKRRIHLSDPETLIKKLRSKPQLSQLEKRQLEEMSRFEDALKAALEVKIPHQLDEKILLNSRIKKRTNFNTHVKGFLTMAASFAVVSFLILRFMVFTPSSALANDALTHLYHDIEHLDETQLDAATRLKESMHSLGVNKTVKIKSLRYARNCHVGKNPSVHLIIEVNSMIYTVLFLPDVKSTKEESFKDEHYHGKIIPLKKGSIIVMGMSRFPLKPAISEMRQNFS